MEIQILENVNPFVKIIPSIQPTLPLEGASLDALITHSVTTIHLSVRVFVQMALLILQLIFALRFVHHGLIHLDSTT